MMSNTIQYISWSLWLVVTVILYIHRIKNGSNEKSEVSVIFDVLIVVGVSCFGVYIPFLEDVNSFIGFIGVFIGIFIVSIIIIVFSRVIAEYIYSNHIKRKRNSTSENE